MKEGLGLESQNGQCRLATDEQREIADVGADIHDGSLFQRPQDRSNEPKLRQQVLSGHQQRGDGFGPRSRMGQSACAKGHGHQTGSPVDPAQQRVELPTQGQGSDQSRSLDWPGRWLGHGC